MKEICRIGLECTGTDHTLGDGGMGVTVWRCPDLCLRAFNWPASGSAFLLVFKVSMNSADCTNVLLRTIVSKVVVGSSDREKKLNGIGKKRTSLKKSTAPVAILKCFIHPGMV